MKKLDIVDSFPSKSLCITCSKYRKVFFAREITTVHYRNKVVKYEEIIPYCVKCGFRIDVPGVWDENLRRIQEEYNTKK